MFSLPITGRAQGYQQITVTGIVNLTPPPQAKSAYIVVEVASVRWRDDGIAPTATVGMLLVSTAVDPTMIYNSNLSAIQFIAVSGTPILNVTYYQ